MLTEWDKVFRGVEQHEIIPSRLNAIMVSALADKKREGEHPGQYEAIKGSGNQSRLGGLPETLASYTSLRWALEKSRPFSFKWAIRGRRTELRGQMDYALWYGKRADFETNLVVLPAEEVYGASTCVPHVLSYMGKFSFFSSPMYHASVILIMDGS
jgi:hypothetical protein